VQQGGDGTLLRMAAERVVQADETARIKALRADHLSILCEISGEDERDGGSP
jgi:hypothetical protein